MPPNRAARPSRPPGAPPRTRQLAGDRRLQPSGLFDAPTAGPVIGYDPYGRPSVVSMPDDHPGLAAIQAAQAWPRAREALRVRLQRVDNVMLPPVDGMVVRPLAGDLVVSLGVVVPGGIGTVLAESLAGWPLPPDDVWVKAAENLERDDRRLRVRVMELEAPAGRWDGLTVELACLEGTSAAHSGRALLLDTLFQQVAPHGRLVSVPNREVVWAHTIRDDSAEAALEALQVLTDSDHRAGDKPLSTAVFWAPPGRPPLEPGWVALPDPAFDDLLRGLPPAVP